MKLNDEQIFQELTLDVKSSGFNFSELIDFVYGGEFEIIRRELLLGNYGPFYYFSRKDGEWINIDWIKQCTKSGGKK